MNALIPEAMHGTPAPLAEGERLVDTFRADPRAYWRGHAIMVVLFGIFAGAALALYHNPNPWVGPLAAVLAIGARAAYLRSEALAEEWRLTDRRLLGPGGRIVPLSGLVAARPFLGAVQLVAANGDKHLIKYQADPAATVKRIAAVAVKVP